MAIGIYCALVAESIEHGIVMSVNHDGDSDSTGSIAGNLLGAMYGEQAIPNRWLESLQLKSVITEIADDLCQCWAWHLNDQSLMGEIRKKYPAM